MTCPVCSAAVGPEDRFCSNCGNPLTSEDRAEGRDHTEFVSEELLTKITEARSGHAMRGERRTVTMLFADIKGSTAMAESLDPEDWADIVNGAFEHLIAPVYRYEGTLARLQGDAVLAFFGAPIAHEDDPIRAVRAGLEIIDRLGPYKTEMMERWEIPIDVRVGINTGLVVVGAVGSDLKVEYTALGDAVNVAARMEQTAEPGTVRVTEETWELISDHFEGEPLGPVDVKGKSEPVSAVRVVAHKSTVDTPAERPLIGRSEELMTLEDVRERLAGGSGWITSIMGEAGLGKTRLLEEFRRRTLALSGVGAVYGEAPEMAWMSSFSQSYDSSVPYSTINDLLDRWWALNAQEDPYRRVEEIADSVVPDLPDAVVYLGYVAGIPLPDSASDLIAKLEPPVLQKRARETFVSYIEAEAGRRPVIVTFEDTHWADSMSLSFLDDLMELAEKGPLGLLLSMRPYRDEPIWRTHEVALRDHPHRYKTIDLGQFSYESARDLLDALLAEDTAVPEETRQDILERAGGNPLFIEQMARAIKDTDGDEDFTVPTGLTTLLTARLDRLDETSREVAQTASVIGSEFRRAALASVLEEDVDVNRSTTELLRRGIFVERDPSSGTLAFSHALIQDAAYSTMLLRTRRELHGRVANHLVETSPDSAQEIARHLIDAGSEQAAFPYLIEAGEQSSRSMALADAIRFYTTALDNIPSEPDPELVVKAHDGLGVAYSLIPDLSQSEAAYQALADYADSAGRPSAKVKALNRLALNAAMLAGDIPGAHRYLEEAYTVAKEAGDEFGLAEYHMNACVISGFGGDLEASVRHDEETARQGEALGVDEIRVEGLVRLATNAVWLMDFDKAEQALEEAIKAAEASDDEMRLTLVQVMGSSRMQLRDGDTESALQILLESTDTLNRYASFYTPFATTLMGTLLYDRGDIETGVSHVSETHREAVDQQTNLYIAMTAAALVRMYGSLHITDPLPELRSSALEAVQAPLGNYLASTVWADLGYANLALRDIVSAGDDFANGLAAVSATQYWEKPRLLIGSALVAIETGDLAKAHRLLDEAQAFLLEKELRLFDAALGHARGKLLLAETRYDEALEKLTGAFESATTAGLRPQAAQIAVTAAAVAAATGDGDGARQHEETARSLVGEMAAAIIDDELRAAVETVWLEPLDQLTTG